MVAGLGGDRLPGLERDVRRVADDHVDGAGQVVEGVGQVAQAQVDAGAGQVARRPSACAGSSSSTACTRARGTSSATALAIAPEPVHEVDHDRLRRRRARPARRPSRPAARSRAGARRRPGPTASSTWRNAGACRSGAAAARGPRAGATRASYALDCGASATSSTQRRSRHRSMPSTWASSSSASCSGLATPAAAQPVVRPSATQRRARRVTSARAPSSRAARSASTQESMTGCEVAVEHLVEVVGLVAGAVVGDPVLRVVVGADPLGAVDGADLAAAGVAGLGVGLLLGRGEQPGAQDAHRLLLVLELALLVLAADHDAGRHVGDPDGRVGGVDALAAGAAAAEDVDAQVVLVDLRRRPARPRAAPGRRRRWCARGPATR